MRYLIKITAIVPVLALTFGGAAFAAAHLDTDGDGMMSYDELLVAYPDLTEETYGEIDTDDDGAVSADELTAAVEAGTVPAAE